ncbi:hypothetical protein SDC9_191420 [bioreactor metagenome]|uniref:Uncharacterized protein n=1 Tax=bioreactor metagenome TaxID=1076179 RepID=A0A645I091_9ZZZZ
MDGFPVSRAKFHGHGAIVDAGGGEEAGLGGNARITVAVGGAGGRFGIIGPLIRGAAAIAHIRLEGACAEFVDQRALGVKKKKAVPRGADIKIQMQIIFFLPIGLVQARCVDDQVFSGIQRNIRKHPFSNRPFRTSSASPSFSRWDKIFSMVGAMPDTKLQFHAGHHHSCPYPCNRHSKGLPDR